LGIFLDILMGGAIVGAAGGAAAGHGIDMGLNDEYLKSVGESLGSGSSAIVAGTLRIAIELVGGATGPLPPDWVSAQELAVRKAAGTDIEFAPLIFVGWSPLWLFAAAADLTAGTRTYLHALVSELRSDGLLPEDTVYK
jgi:hypothetical protein